MKTSEYIGLTINKLPKGYIFTYSNFISEVNRKEAVIKALNRMADSGKIQKLSKGKFYKPETSVFGNLKPTQAQVVKDLLDDDGKPTGYLTGYRIFNQLGLTTQVSNTIQIGKNEIRPAFKRELYTIAFIKQKNTITKENIPFLQLLDAIRYIKKIPDANNTSACIRLIAILRDYKDQDKLTLVKLSLKYPPATRALLGALLEETQNSSITVPLRKSLNPITVYKLPGVNNVLPNAINWNIR